MKYNILMLPLLILLYTRPVGAQFYQPPQPLAEQSEIKSWLEKELIYPEAALDSKIQGKVEVHFAVDENGQASDFRISEGLNETLDKEAIRLVRKLEWKPAMNAGQAVEAHHSYSIRFNIRQYNRMVRNRGYTLRENPYEPVDTSQKIYNFGALDKAPQPLFRDKSIGLARYIQQELNYPSTALTLSISGTVSLAYVIEEHGLVSNIHIVQSVGGGCDNEAIRLLQDIEWMPGIKNDTAVRSYGKLDIIFRLPDGSRQQAVPNQQQRSM